MKAAKNVIKSGKPAPVFVCKNKNHQKSLDSCRGAKNVGNRKKLGRCDRYIQFENITDPQGYCQEMLSHLKTVAYMQKAYTIHEEENV